MDAATNDPLFTIVIPAFNRAALIGRALASCLGQVGEDFEIVVVDDGSTDRTAQAVLDFVDPRIRLISHAKNRGVCSARNTGADGSRGRWVIFLDSDDELISGSLETIRSRVLRLSPEVHRAVFMYRLDGGGLSPDPPLGVETWDYEGFIRWISTLRGSGDFLNVVKKAAFEQVRFPEGKAAEPLFHLDFVSVFLTHTFPDVVGIVHSDASNRSKHFSVERLKSEASDNAAALSQLVFRHGPALQRWGPDIHFEYVRCLSTALFLAGRRGDGIRVCFALLRQRMSLKVLAVMAVGLLGPTPLAWLKSRLSLRL